MAEFLHTSSEQVALLPTGGWRGGLQCALESSLGRGTAGDGQDDRNIVVLPNTAASIMHPLLKMAAQRRIRVIEAPFKWPLLEKTEQILPFDSEVEEQAEEGSSGTLDLSSTSSSAAAIITASIESCITASTTAVLVEHVHGLTGAEMPLYEIGNNVLNMSICG